MTNSGKELQVKKMGGFYFVMLSAWGRSSKFHVKDYNLSCAAGKRLLTNSDPRYGEMIIDVERTLRDDYLWLAYYIGGIWYWSAPYEELGDGEWGLCPKCACKLLEYLKSEIKLKAKNIPELAALVKSNKDLIHEAITSWPN